MIDYLENVYQSEIENVSKREKLFAYDMLHTRLISKKFIVALISVKPPNKRQWGAATVEMSAAEEGYGPLIYDIAMEHEGTLTADRDSVTPSATKVWKYYHDNRPDVKAKEFDDEDNPKTPSKFDDAQTHTGGAENPLNYAYSTTKSTQLKSLLNNHEVADPILKKYKVKISELASSYFHRKYLTNF